MGQLLSTYQISHGFAGKQLFRDVSLGIDEGDRIGLVGPNGAGKSTLMKIIAGIIKPDQGQVTLRRGLRLGYLAQSPVFDKEATILSALIDASEDHDYEKAFKLISEFELDQFPDDIKAVELSGGWQKKLALACEIIKDPDLLLLDEPTNHLDVKSIKWLEDFLDRAQFASVVITHDRLFLQRVTNKIFDLDPKNPNFLLSVAGGYLQFLENKAIMLFSEQQRESHLRNQLRREKEWLARGAKARQTKQKARIERAHELGDEVSDLKVKNRDRRMEIDFESSARTPKKLIEVKNISKSYAGRPLFKNLNLLIGAQTRLALLGDNGTGKSTLIRCLIGAEKPNSGSVFIADGLEVAYFEQSRETLVPEKSLLKNIIPEGDFVQFRGQSVFALTYLEKFGFRRDQMDQPVNRLSGGEQARLRLAQLMLKTCQLLILDEPTNDLDVDTLNVLEQTLKDFSGAVILVTHDRYFMDQVCDQIMALGSEENPIFTGYMQWEAWFEEGGSKSKIMSEKLDSVATSIGDSGMAIGASGTASAASGTPGAVKTKKLSYKEQIEFEQMESKITDLEGTLASVERDLVNPEYASNAAKISELCSLQANLSKQLELSYARWAELEAKLK